MSKLSKRKKAAIARLRRARHGKAPTSVLSPSVLTGAALGAFAFELVTRMMKNAAAGAPTEAPKLRLVKGGKA